MKAAAGVREEKQKFSWPVMVAALKEVAGNLTPGPSPAERGA